MMCKARPRDCMNAESVREKDMPDEALASAAAVPTSAAGMERYGDGPTSGLCRPKGGCVGGAAAADYTILILVNCKIQKCTRPHPL